jgi:hypothetical protein
MGIGKLFTPIGHWLIKKDNIINTYRIMPTINNVLRKNQISKHKNCNYSGNNTLSLIPRHPRRSIAETGDLQGSKSNNYTIENNTKFPSQNKTALCIRSGTN